MSEITKDKFRIIKEAFELKQYDVVIQESCKIFEVLMKKLYLEAISKFDSQSRGKIIESEFSGNTNNKGIDSMTFGEVIGLYRSCRFFDVWGEQTGRDPEMLKAINFATINRLRNASTHKVRNQEIDFNSANFVYRNLEHFISLIGYPEFEKYISTFTDKAPRPPNGARLIAKGKAPPRTQNVYDVMNRSEIKRLEFQRSLLRTDDINAIRNICQEKHSLSAIDIGCNDGMYSYDRLKDISEIVRVIGVDRDEAIIESAEVGDSRFSFFVADCNAEGFDDRLDQIADDTGAREFDLVIASMVLLHLKQPFKALKSIRRVVKEGGSIFIRDMDDGLALAYPDPNEIVPRMHRISRDIPGTGHRHSGREIYALLKRTGFRNIAVHKTQVDTAGMNFEQRELLFETNFSFIRTDLANAANEDPQSYSEDWEWISEAYEELEELFQSKEFYYRMGTMVFSAMK